MMAVWSVKTLVDIFARNLGLPPLAKWESPMEGLFFQEAERAIDGIECQYPIGPYRADFAVPAAKLAIEVDGRAYHSTPEQIERDRNRQDYIESQGWKVVRFSGSQVYNDVDECIRTTKHLIFIRTLFQGFRNERTRKNTLPPD